MGTLNDDDYDYVYELDEETRELVNENEAGPSGGARGEEERTLAVEGYYVYNIVEDEDEEDDD